MGDEASDIVDEQQIRHPPFRAAYEADSVSLSDLVIASAMREHADETRREIANHDYPLLRKKFLEKHKEAQIVIQSWAAIGACLNAGDDGALELIAVRNSLRFRWQSARAVQMELNELDDDALRWLPAKERQSFRLHIYGLITQVHTSVALENRRHAPGPTDNEPSEQLEPELASLRPLVGRAKERFKEEAERAAQVKYAAGMGVGTAVLATLCAVGGACFLWQHIPAVYGVGVIAGGIGACLSVLQRLTRRKLRLDYKTEPKMLTWFGGVRPFVGAVAGMIAFTIIKAGLVSSVVVVPTGTGAYLAFVAFFAFLASFSERFFQDMLRVAGHGLGDAAGKTEGGYEPAREEAEGD